MEQPGKNFLRGDAKRRSDFIILLSPLRSQVTLVVALLLGAVLGEIDAPLTEDFRNGPLAALDAVRYANAPVAAAGDGEAGNPGAAVIDPCDPVEVPQGVLGHAEVPPEDAREERLRKGVESQDVTKLGE